MNDSFRVSSMQTRAVRGLVVGEIDVDSHARNAFQPEDREFPEKCAETVGQYMERMDRLKS